MIFRLHRTFYQDFYQDILHEANESITRSHLMYPSNSHVQKMNEHNVKIIEKTGKANVLSSNENKYITLITCNQKRKGYQVVLVGKLVEQNNY